ncbi:MAG: iron transporter [Ruminococcus sp.]|nr:iron transporter [Ruminococcus sp.]
MTKKIVGISLAAMMAMSLAACGDADSSTKDSAATTESKADAASAEVKEDDATASPEGDGAGFTEYPIFEDQEVGFLNVSAVYFQPVPMTDGNNVEDYDIHLEADISALENKLGFGVGDWVPYLTVEYKLTKESGDVAAEGTFMEMSASDGPHYGANIKLPDADTYNVEFTIHSPAENNYLLHTDAETGPGGSFDDYFKDGNLKVTFEGWNYVPQEW